MKVNVQTKTLFYTGELVEDADEQLIRQLLVTANFEKVVALKNATVAGRGVAGQHVLLILDAAEVLFIGIPDDEALQREQARQAALAQQEPPGPGMMSSHWEE